MGTFYQSKAVERSAGRGFLPRWLCRRPEAACALLVLAAGIPLFAEKLQDLKPQGYVNDFAGVISADTRGRLAAVCGEVEQKAQAQIAVVTVHNLDGDSVEDFTNRLGDKWGVGRRSSRGVLILLAVDDHRYRVEVGYGLEPILNDAKVGDFGRTVVPALRRGDYSGAVLQLTWSVASVIAQDRGVALTGAPPPESTGAARPVSVPPWIALLFFLFLFGGFGVMGFFIRRNLGRHGPRGGGWWGGPGPWIGGGFGRGGFGGFGGGFGGGGGGGFGGFGGGSFGGGGASGSW